MLLNSEVILNFALKNKKHKIYCFCIQVFKDHVLKISCKVIRIPFVLSIIMCNYFFGICFTRVAVLTLIDMTGMLKYGDGRVSFWVIKIV